MAGYGEREPGKREEGGGGVSGVGLAIKTHGRSVASDLCPAFKSHVRRISPVPASFMVGDVTKNGQTEWYQSSVWPLSLGASLDN